MDALQAVATFATGAAGCLSMMKAIQIMEKRRHARNSQAVDEVSSPHPKLSRLFPNGEKDAIIDQINVLILENRERKKEAAENRINHGKISATLQDITERLERAGIV